MSETLEDGTDSPETSVLNQPTLRNNPEDGRIQFNRSGSLRSGIRNEYVHCKNDVYRQALLSAHAHIRRVRANYRQSVFHLLSFSV